jgi:predicted amidohydrolase
MDFSVAVEQVNPRLGDLHTNLADHVERVEAAAAAGAALVVFPELSLTGYFLKDQVLELGLTLDSPELGRLADLSRKASIAVGFVERTPEERLHNAYAFFEDGALIGVHRKVHLVSYGLFDEGRDFAAGDRYEVFDSRLGRFGPLICEDLWHAPGGYLHFLNDADALLVASASPARGAQAGAEGLGSQRDWDTLLGAAALQYRSYVVFAARVGWEDGIGFGGGSCVFDPFGAKASALEGLDAGVLHAQLDGGALRRARFETPLRRDAKPWVLAAGLARATGLEPTANEGDPKP